MKYGLIQEGVRMTVDAGWPKGRVTDNHSRQGDLALASV